MRGPSDSLLLLLLVGVGVWLLALHFDGDIPEPGEVVSWCCEQEVPFLVLDLDMFLSKGDNTLGITEGGNRKE